MIDPATASLIASAVSGAMESYGAAVGAKTKKKAQKRERHEHLLHEILNRGAEHHGHRQRQGTSNAKKKAATYSDTSDVVRGALSI